MYVLMYVLIFEDSSIYLTVQLFVYIYASNLGMSYLGSLTNDDLKVYVIMGVVTEKNTTSTMLFANGRRKGFQERILKRLLY